MSDRANQAIQASVAKALLLAVIFLVPLSIPVYWLAGESTRAIRSGFGFLVLLPFCIVLWRRLQQGHSRQVLIAISLLMWASLTAQLLNAGTVFNPILPILLTISMTGALAQDRLLTWLMPLLCTTTVITAATFEAMQILPLRTPGSSIGLTLGWVLGMSGLVLLSSLAGRYFAQLNAQVVATNLELQQLSSQLQLAIKAGRITCFSIDPTRLTVHVTGDSCELLQCPAGEQPISEIKAFSLADRQRITQAIVSSNNTSSVPALDCLLADGPQQGRWYRLFAVTGEQNVAQLICALQDIDEEKKTDLAKENFTAMVSHELRTPLTALLGSLSLLRGLHAKDMSDSAQQLLEMAYRGGERLAKLVNEILDFFKLQAGRMPINARMLPIEPDIALAIDSVSALLQERQLTLHREGISGGQIAYHDNSRTQQVLTNLLSNAIKFSPPGGQLWLRIDLSAEHLRVSLRDSGPGIPEAFQQHMFEPFSQANMSNTRDDNSSGLGLAFSRQLMHLMGGELSFSSPPGEGATFHADFLRHPPQTPA